MSNVSLDPENGGSTSQNSNITAWYDEGSYGNMTWAWKCDARKATLNGASSPQLAIYFMWSAPTNAVVSGIKLYLTRGVDIDTSSQYCNDNEIFLHMNDGSSSSNKKKGSSTHWPDYPYGQTTYGSSSDTWGLSGDQLLGTNFENFDLRVRLNMTCTQIEQSAMVDLDGSWIEITYSIQQPPEPPTINTRTPRNITDTTAESGGSGITSVGTPLIRKGIEWGKRSGGPLESYDDYTSDTGSFWYTMDSLDQGTEYKVRAVAENSEGTTYGDWKYFTTTAPVPSMQTYPADTITQTTARSGVYNISSPTGIIMKGICWNTSGNPSYPSDPSNGQSTTDMSDTHYGLTGLAPNTTYYVRAFAINSYGTGYGDQISFTTATYPTPSITTRDPNLTLPAITMTTATSGGISINLNGCTMLGRGVRYWPTLDPSNVIDLGVSTSDPSDFLSYLTGLTRGVSYTVCAYLNLVEWGRWDDTPITFITLNPTPSITTRDPDLTLPPVGVTTATGGAINIVLNGNTQTGKGIVYYRTGHPEEAIDLHLETSSTADFLSYMTGLTPDTDYTCYSYLDLTYWGRWNGATETFRTLTRPTPSITTRDPDLTIPTPTQTTATGGGISIVLNGNTQTGKGIVYYRTGYPGEAIDLHLETSSTADFLSYMVSLLPATDYTCYAYLDLVEWGRWNGATTTFRTLDLVAPTITTKYPDSITHNAAHSGGQDINLNGNHLTGKGLLYWKTSDPGTKWDLGISTTDPASFDSYMTGLTAATNYSCVAYLDLTEWGRWEDTVRTFTTTATPVPSITTKPVTNILKDSAQSGGYLINLNGCTLLGKGLKYYPTSDPSAIVDLGMSTSDPSSFDSYMTGLTPDTNYLCYAYLNTVEWGIWMATSLQFRTLPPGFVYRWTGSAWVLIPVKEASTQAVLTVYKHNGSGWVTG